LKGDISMKMVAIKIMIGLIFCMLLTGCNSITEVERKTSIESNDMKEKELQEYSDSKFNIYVSFPKSWRSEIEKTLEATSTNEASPDGGIRMYIDEGNDNFIYAYGCVGSINIPKQGFKEEIIKRNGQEDLIFLISESSGGIEAHYLYDQSHAISMRLKKDIFDYYKLEIYEVLKSFRVNE
jgi:hypothetical protein